MSSCKILADRYAKEQKLPIPPASASLEEKKKWLYVSQWGCILPGKTLSDFMPNDQFDLKGPCYLQNDKPAPGNQVSSTLNARPPVLNYLKETGFLAWVNERGLKCVNKIVGNFFGLNTETGLVNVPSVSVTPMQNQCWGSCQNVTSSSSMCFECINQVLQNTPDLCPDLNPNDPNNEKVMSQAVDCHFCVSQQGGYVGTAEVPDDNAIMNNIFVCVNSSLSTPLSAAVISVIVIVSVMILTAVIALSVYFGYIKPRQMKNIRERDELIHNGINPDDM